MVVVPVMVGLEIMGEENVAAASSSPYNSVKFSLIFRNAVRNGSPVPSFAVDPMLISCFVI